jgi:1-acyl-sn-glycerol-3-phosphate acyltransferase
VGAYYSATRFLASIVCGVLSGWEVRGLENVPRRGGLIVASNHRSFWDPPMISSALHRDVHFLAKEELFSVPVLGTAIRGLNAIPIRRGAADLSGLARAIAALKAGGSLLMFPEGSRMRDGELHPPRPGVGLIAVQADVPIVPCYISGSDQQKRWLSRSVRVRIWFGGAQPWRELAGADGNEIPGRSLYQRVGEGVMREIAVLKSGQERTASRGAA